MWDEKYSHLGSEVKELPGGSEPEYLGFVLSARGKWLEMNNALLTFLNIEKYKSFAQQISRLTTSLTLEILHFLATSE